jgi:hypothetical protein
MYGISNLENENFDFIKISTQIRNKISNFE